MMYKSRIAGIGERRFATQPTGTSELSLHACLKALCDAVKKKKVKRGNNIILAAFGSGFT